MNDCIFCKIANGEIPSTTIFEDEDFKVFLDLGPATKGHTLVIPKKHYENIFEMPDELLGKAFSLAKKIGNEIMAKLGASGVNIVQNNGTSAGQTVFHFHIHVIPRYDGDDAGFGWNEGTLNDDIKQEILSKFN